MVTARAMPMSVTTTRGGASTRMTLEHFKIAMNDPGRVRSYQRG